MKKRLIDISQLTSFKNSGNINILCIKDPVEIIKIHDPFIIGAGSNLLISPKTKKNIVKVINSDSIIKKDKYIQVDSGVKSNTFLKFCIQNNIKGFEFLSGIPGTLGGIVTMNAGSWGKEIKDNIFKVISFDFKKNKIIERKKGECGFSYRDSCFKNTTEIVIKIIFDICGDYKDIDIKKSIKENYVKKLKSQPVLKRTFGSVFKNPENISAWKLLKECGLQGVHKNDAHFSSKHANFLENSGNASFDDVKYLIEKAKQIVFQKRGILLEEEVIIVE